MDDFAQSLEELWHLPPISSEDLAEIGQRILAMAQHKSEVQMSNTPRDMQTWTDEELQSHIAAWDERWHTGERFDVTFCSQFVQPWEGSGYSLICEGEHVALTIQQALMIECWFRPHITKEKSKPVPRDTQFEQFARLLWQEIASELLVLDDDPAIVDGCAICNIPEKVATVIEPLITQRAYDLANHALDSVPFDYDWPMELTIDQIPDMSAWPKAGEA